MNDALSLRIATICNHFNQQPAYAEPYIDSSNPRDIIRELSWRASVISPKSISRLLAAGISREAIYGQGKRGTVIGCVEVPSPLFVGIVVFLDDGRFEWTSAPTDNAKAIPAFLGLCHDIEGRATDIFATSPRTGQFGTLYGFAGVVEEGELFRPRIAEELVVYRTFLSWLLADRSGAFVVNWPRAVALLRDAGPLLADSIEHGRIIREKLALPEVTIRIRIQNERSAA